MERGHGYTVEAVRHAQAARDWPQAARLLAASHISLILDGRLSTVRALLEALSARPRGGRPGARTRVRRYPASRRSPRRCRHVPRGRRGAGSDGAGGARGLVRTAPGERQARVRQPPRRPGGHARCDAITGGCAHDPDGRHARAEQRHPRLGADEPGGHRLWALELEDARRHLEEALTLARRIGRAYLEIGCLAHLGIAAPSAGSPRPRRLGTRSRPWRSQRPTDSTAIP